MAAVITDDDKVMIVEYRLTEWGRLSRQFKDNLGYPRSSSISDMMDHVKVWTKQRKPRWGFVTAQGKQKRVFKPQDIDVQTADWFMDIDRQVATLPNWMAKPIKRAYLWGQPDRIAARELRISREEFTSAREKAVMYIAERLARLGRL